MPPRTLRARLRLLLRRRFLFFLFQESSRSSPHHARPLRPSAGGRYTWQNCSIGSSAVRTRVQQVLGQLCAAARPKMPGQAARLHEAPSENRTAEKEKQTNPAGIERQSQEKKERIDAMNRQVMPSLLPYAGTEHACEPRVRQMNRRRQKRNAWYVIMVHTVKWLPVIIDEAGMSSWGHSHSARQ